VVIEKYAATLKQSVVSVDILCQEGRSGIARGSRRWKVLPAIPTDAQCCIPILWFEGSIISSLVVPP